MHWKKIGTLLSLILPSTVLADNTLSDLTQLSISELSKLKISSVSKQYEETFRAPSAIHTITQQDIQSSTAYNIPDLLRNVPGINVAQISANKWAITSRGFNDQLANKLLVLIDGRAVYTSHFAGVHWDVQDTLLQDIQRIEIIRGPGSTLWGSNAVNGIINIITKTAKNTQHSLVTTGFGTTQQNITATRYGNQINNNIYYRAYAKHTSHQSLKQLDTLKANDNWHMKRGGFRFDVEHSPTTSYTIQGDIYDGNANKNRVATYPTLTPPYSQQIIDSKGGDIGGGNILTRLNKNISSKSKIKLQIYYDNTRRDYSTQQVLQQTIDADFQHMWQPTKNHNIIWGLGNRHHFENNNQSDYFNYQKLSKTYHIYNVFLQDKITLKPNNLFLTLGSKLEHNTLTNTQIQPSTKLSWHINPTTTLWNSISHATRTPSRSEQDLHLVTGTNQTPPATFTTWQGNKNFKPEKLTSYELGYRFQPTSNLSFDSNIFYNYYNNLRTVNSSSQFDNNGKGHTYGIELSTIFDPTHKWRLTANYSFLKLNLHTHNYSTDTTLKQQQGSTPQNTFNLHSKFNITNNITLNTQLHFQDNLTTKSIPAYLRLDSKLTWQPTKNILLNLTAQNLTDKYHQEFTNSLFSSPTKISRNFFAQLTLTY